MITIALLLLLSSFVGLTTIFGMDALEVAHSKREPAPLLARVSTAFILPALVLFFTTMAVFRRIPVEDAGAIVKGSISTVFRATTK